MPETYAGTVVELGGEELGRSGHAKPRKVVIKADPTAQFGKTFRVWQDSDSWETLSRLNGKHVVVLYDVEEREGGPQGKYTQNMIVGVDAPDSVDGAGVGPSTDSGGTPPPTTAAGTPASSADHSGWGSPPVDVWTGRVVQETKDPTTNYVSKDDYWKRKEDKDDDRTNQMASAWAISQAIAIMSVGAKEPPQDQVIERVAHELLILKERMAAELAQ